MTHTEIGGARRSATERRDVVVVGAGVAGLATAYALARGGVERPLLLEQFDLFHDRGSSHGSTRILRLSHSRVEDVRDAVEAFRLWDELERDTGRRLRLKVGSLDFGSHARSVEAALGACEVSAQWLDADEIRSRFPMIRGDADGALYQPDGAIGLANETLRAVAERAGDLGAEIRDKVTVDRLSVNSDGVRLDTSEGGIEARCVVVCTGPWISQLLDQVDLSIPATPTLQTPVHVPFLRPRSELGPTVIETLPDGRNFYGLVQPGGNEVKGGLSDPGPPPDLDGARPVLQHQVDEFLGWAKHRYVELASEPDDAYGCVYTRLPDDGFHLRRDGAVVTVSCCSGRGFKFLPLIGERAARLAKELLTSVTAR